MKLAIVITLHIYSSPLSRNSVPVAWRLAGDEHSYGICAAIDRLMLLAWRDFESLTGLKNKVMMLDFEGELSFENKEELAWVDVGVTRLAGAGRHELFDDA